MAEQEVRRCLWDVGPVRKPFTYFCLILCFAYALMLMDCRPDHRLVRGDRAHEREAMESGREEWEFFALVADVVLVEVGLPSCIGLLRRYLSGGSAALREASRWSWISPPAHWWRRCCC